MKKLDPECFKGNIGFAVTNRGELIPCCYCDVPNTINDPKFAKLLAVSKLSEVDCIQEILLTDEWQEFYSDLLNNKGPPACWNTCLEKKGDDVGSRRESVVTPNVNRLIRTHNV